MFLLLKRKYVPAETLVYFQHGTSYYILEITTPHLLHYEIINFEYVLHKIILRSLTFCTAYTFSGGTR
jgi:hypothetical protein